MIYLAAPYGHKDPQVIHERMQKVCEFAMHLTEKGKLVVSPLFCTVIGQYLPDTDLSYNFWADYCLKLLRRVDALYVLKLPDWEYSPGVQEEINHAYSLNIPVIYFNEDFVCEERVEALMLGTSKSIKQVATMLDTTEEKISHAMDSKGIFWCYDCEQWKDTYCSNLENGC